MSPVEMLTIAEVARRMRVSKMNVHRLIKSRKLAAFNIGPRSLRVDSSDLESFMQRCRIQPE